MYLYFLSKKTQDIDTLWNKTKSKYKEKMADLVFSLEGYINTSGKANRDERILTAFLILESLPTLPFFAAKSVPSSLKKSIHGKPYFENSSIKINIAHNEDFVLVAYDENAEIGVDLEGEIEPQKVEKLSERFASISSLKTAKLEEKISAFIMKENGKFESIKFSTADENFTTKWTTAEAIMKCDGRGFSTLPELEKIKEKMKICTMVFDSENGKEYIAVAIKK